jgi:hypothetical protein
MARPWLPDEWVTIPRSRTSAGRHEIAK